MNNAQSLAAERAEVMLAFARGEKLQWRYRTGVNKNWHISNTPGWDWSVFTFRITPCEPPPKPLERWVNVYDRDGYGHFAHDSLEHANRYAHPGRIRCVHMIEVVDENKD